MLDVHYYLQSINSSLSHWFLSYSYELLFWGSIFFFYVKNCSIQSKPSFIKMMGKGTDYVIDLLRSPDPSGESPAHRPIAFSHKKSHVPDSTASFFMNNSLPTVATFWLMFKKNKHFYGFRSFFRYWQRSVQISMCPSIIFKTRLLCTIHLLIYLLLNFQFLFF